MDLDGGSVDATDAPDAVDVGDSGLCTPPRSFCPAGIGCVDLMTDPMNCGGCGAAFACASGVCAAGTCVARDGGADAHDVTDAAPADGAPNDASDAADASPDVAAADGSDVVNDGPTGPACDDTATMPSAALDAYCAYVASVDGFTWDPSYRAGPPRCITHGEPLGSPYAPTATGVCETCAIDPTLGYEVCRCFRTPHGPFTSAAPPLDCTPP